ncbi:MAG: S8 family serine peptidase [Chitinivibrionales bacterium]|nr:S8 family serine peptidase [Chitinivibrionales bacterium]
MGFANHLFQLCVLLPTLAAAQLPTITNAFGERAVAAYRAQAGMAKAQSVRSGVKYGFLILKETVPNRLLKQIEHAGELSILGIRSVSQGYPIYKVHCHGDIEQSSEALNGYPFFHNLIPISEYDKVTPKIWYDHQEFAKGEIDTADGKVFAVIRFFRNVDSTQRDAILAAHVDSVLYSNDLIYYVKAVVDDLRRLGEMPAVEAVSEIDVTPEPVLYGSKGVIEVDSLQDFDTVVSHFPPLDTAYWFPTTSLNGTDIRIDIWDTGIDSLVLDFREWDRSRPVLVGLPDSAAVDSSVLRRFPGSVQAFTDYNGHGTHVAGIAASNGWQSSRFGLPTYSIRGVSPKAFLVPHGMRKAGNDGDVNNHSHVEFSGAYYTTTAEGIDDVLSRHNPDPNIIVYAAANNGLASQYGSQRGYYSLLVNSKNVITVGAVYSEQEHEGQPVRAHFSSMGPTRDGRIKPDVMAPGDSHIRPTRDSSSAVLVEFDSVAIIDSLGNTKVGWGFSTGTMGWTHGYNVTNIHEVNTVLTYNDISQNGSYIWSDSTYKIGIPPKCDINDMLYLRYRITPPPHDPGIDSLNMEFLWRVDNNAYHRGANSFMIDISDTVNFHTVRVRLGDLEDDWTRFYGGAYPANDTLVAVRIDLGMASGSGGIMSCATTRNGSGYVRMPGTSMAAPHVTGVVGLLLQHYKERYLDPVGLSIHTDAFWNSTAKALLIHTATDLVKETPYIGETPNPDTDAPILYHAGPDYATGWGLVNALDAAAHVDTNLFKEDSIDHAEAVVYKFNKPAAGDCRVTLAWDDPGMAGSTAGNCYDNKLVNDLDLYVIDPFGNRHEPWVLDTLPHGAGLPGNGIDSVLTAADIQPAYRGVDDRNNVEVVDIESAVVGEYAVVVFGADIPMSMQDFSLVASDTLRKDTTTTVWLNDINHAIPGDTIVVPSGAHELFIGAEVPATVDSVVLILQPGTTLRFTQGCEGIYLDTTGSIVGAENVTLEPQVILYNTPTPREPLPADNIIGLFGNLCDALEHGRSGRTTKVGPGIYNWNTVADEGLIGVVHARRDSSSIIRMGFSDSEPGCANYTGPTPPDTSVTLIRNMRVELNDDVYGDTVMTIWGKETIRFENSIFQALRPQGSSRNVVPFHIGTTALPCSGTVEFNNCVFTGHGTAIRVVTPMGQDESPRFTNTVFENNGTDLQFQAGSQAICGIEANQLHSIQVGATRYEGEQAINELIGATCGGGLGKRAVLSVSDPGFVDPGASDIRLTKESPLIDQGTGTEDIGAHNFDMIYTFSRFLDAELVFDSGDRIVMQNGVLTTNTLGDTATVRPMLTLNLRPVYQLSIHKNFISNPSTVTVTVNDGASVPMGLPSDYSVWDARINGVVFADLPYSSLPGEQEQVSVRAIPDDVAPAPVADVQALEDAGDAFITWSPNSEPDISRYKIYRIPMDYPYEPVQIASVENFISEYRDSYGSTDSYAYAVVAYDYTGNQSETVDPIYGALSPVLERVVDNCDGSFTAWFGYENRNNFTVTIPVGTDNHITYGGHGAPDMGQVSTLQPGRTVDAFSIIFDGSNLVWTLGERTATANGDAAQNECGVEYIHGVHERISPVLEYVVDNCDGTFTAHFGYYNRNGFAVHVPVGEYNRFTGNANSGQLKTFGPGRGYDQFTVLFDGSNKVWSLTGKTSTASGGAAQNTCD